MIRNIRGLEHGTNDPDFLRCEWCGIPVSNNWIITRDGKRCCSQDCYIALSGYDEVLFISAIPICFGLLVSVLVFQASLLVAIFIAFMMILTGIFLYYGEKKRVVSIRSEIPKYSRQYPPILVEKISSVAKCPSCSGNLDLTDLDTSAVIACQYCGAMGVLKIES
ncbi:MAG: hypothetical protein ACFFEE_01300 [Candidatus Thorarchaeota archaeon]